MWDLRLGVSDLGLKGLRVKRLGGLYNRTGTRRTHYGHYMYAAFAAEVCHRLLCCLAILIFEPCEL